MRHRYLLFAPLLALSGCVSLGASGLTSIVFVSPTAEYYHAVSTAIWTDLGRTDAQRLNAMTQEPFFGPFRFGTTNRLPSHTSFNIIPICNGAPSLRSMEIHTIEPGTRPSIECKG